MSVDPEAYVHASYETPPGMVIVGMWCHRGCGFMDPGAEDASCWGCNRAHPVYAPADLPTEWIQEMREQLASLEYLRTGESIPTLRERHLEFLNGLARDVQPPPAGAADPYTWNSPQEDA